MKKLIHHTLTLLFLLSYFQLSAQNWDTELAEAINQHPTKFKDQLSSIVANSITPVTLAVPLSIVAVGLLEHDKKYLQDALYVAGAYVINAAMTTALKKIFNERRPFDRYPEEVVYRNGLAGGSSFPSGHTSSAFNLATSLALRYKKPVILIPAFLYAGTMGWARIYQGVHYPLDVLAGAVVGEGTAWISYKFQKFMDRKKHQQR